MPRVFEQDGYIFFFYSNEHEPVHVHVRYAGGEAIFTIGEIVGLRESIGLKVKELSKAEELAKTHKNLILEKWNEHINR